MNLDRQDIEAVAKSRVSRMYSKTSNNWLIGLVIAVIIGLIVAFQLSSIGGYVIWIVAIVAWLVYYNGLTKKQNYEKHRLLREWEHEKNIEVKHD